MRISYWSSDEALPNLVGNRIANLYRMLGARSPGDCRSYVTCVHRQFAVEQGVFVTSKILPGREGKLPVVTGGRAAAPKIGKSGGSGKRVSVRVDLGGRRILKKKN